MSQYSKHDSSSSSSTSSSPEHSGNKHSFSSYEASPPMSNVFANDGSFLEMFKKYQQKQSEQGKVVKEVKKVEASVASNESSTVEAARATSSSKPTPAMPIIGKRRGGKILPTGKVKKVKNDDEDDDTADAKPKDAWSVYMSEVKRYRDTVCQSDDKTRPLPAESQLNRLKEKYSLLKQKYKFVQSKQQVLDEDKDVTIQTLDAELENLIRDQINDKEMIQKLNLDLLNGKKANKDKDVEIAKLRGEFCKIATEYGQFKMQTEADLSTLWRSNGKLNLDEKSETKSDEENRKPGKVLERGRSSITLETHYVNKSFRRSSTQVVYACEGKRGRRCVKPFKKF
ncbi:hypothetical protein WDU94_006516 [Cyamophila willieti]